MGYNIKKVEMGNKEIECFGQFVYENRVKDKDYVEVYCLECDFRNKD